MPDGYDGNAFCSDQFLPENRDHCTMLIAGKLISQIKLAEDKAVSNFIMTFETASFTLGAPTSYV